MLYIFNRILIFISLLSISTSSLYCMNEIKKSAEESNAREQFNAVAVADNLALPNRVDSREIQRLLAPLALSAPIQAISCAKRVNSVTFSPAGDRIIFSDDNIVRLWDLQGNPVHQLSHDFPVSSVIINSEGNLILTATEHVWGRNMPRAFLWKLQDDEIRALQLKDEWFDKVHAFNRSNDKVLISGFRNTLYLWDLKAQKEIKRFVLKDVVMSATFNHAEDKILAGSWYGSAYLWDLEGNILAEFGHAGPVSSAKFNKNETQILTASYGRGTAYLWQYDKAHKKYSCDGRDGALLPKVKFKHDDSVCSAEFNHNETMVLTSSEDQTVRLWDLQGNELARLHCPGVSRAIFDPTGDKILVSSKNNLSLYDISCISNPSQEQIKLIALLNVAKAQVGPANAAKIVHISLKELAEKYNLDHRKLCAALKSFNPEIGNHIIKFYAIIDNINQDGKESVEQQLVSNSENSGSRTQINSRLVAQVICGGLQGGFAQLPRSLVNLIFAYNAPDIADLLLKTPMALKCLQQFTVEDPACSAEIGQQRNNVLVAHGNAAYVYDVQGKPLVKFKHAAKVNCASFNAVQDRVLTASDDRTVRLWNLQANELLCLNHDAQVLSAKFNNANDAILTASKNGKVCLWNLQGIKLKEKEYRSGVPIIGTNNNMLCLDGDATNPCVSIHDFNQPLKGWQMDTNFFPSKPICVALFNPRGTRILTGESNGQVCLYDLKGKKEAQCKLDRSIRSLVCNQAGDRLLSSGHKTACVFTLEGRRLAELNHDANVNLASFSPVGDQAVTVSNDREIRLWDISCGSNQHFNEDQTMLLLLLDQAKRKGIKQISLQELAREQKLNVINLYEALNSFNAATREHIIQAYAITDAKSKEEIEVLKAFC